MSRLLKQQPAESSKPTLLAQWNDEGQVISVFGIGPWKKAAEDFLSTFKLTYSLTEKRIGTRRREALGLRRTQALLRAVSPVTWLPIDATGPVVNKCRACRG